MNIFAAAKTGRRIRRKRWEDKTAFLDEQSYKDVLADDWEVEPIQVSVTREKFEDAWEKSLYPSCMLETFKERILEKIGL